jgi:hypothetical protein
MGGGVGKVLGTAASIAMGRNPLMAFGSTLGSSILENAFAGGGGGGGNAGGGSTPQYALPGYNYGTNTYTLDGKPYDASKYFITGDKGVYNLLPMLGEAYKDPTKTDMTTGSYNTYQTIYNKMAGDAAAQAAFSKAYAPQSYTYVPQPRGPYKGGHYNQSFNSTSTLPNPLSGNLYSGPYPMHGPQQDGGSGQNMLNGGINNRNPYGNKELFGGLKLQHDVRRDLKDTLTNQLAAAGIPQFQRKLGIKPTSSLDRMKALRDGTAPAPYNYTPIQYVNYGLDGIGSQFADYATKGKNPFFVPFAPNPTATTNPTNPTNPTTTPVAPVTPPGPLNTTGSFQTPGRFNNGGIIGLLRK